MTKLDAIKLLQNTLMSMKLSYQEHQLLQQALYTLTPELQQPPQEKQNLKPIPKDKK